MLPITHRQSAVMKSFKNQIAASFYPLARLLIKDVPLQASRQQVWHLIRRYGWRGSERVIKTDQGFVVKGNVAEYLHLCLYLFGVWEECTTRFVAERLKPGDCFIDVGANIGYYSLLSASLVGRAGRVVAIEASPRIYADLINNLALNGVTNVRAVNVAASDSPGELDLFEASEESRGLTTTSATWARQTNCGITGKIQALPLNMLASKQELSAARIIKIDVEGAEWSVCSGLMPALHELRPDAEIILEVTPDEIKSQGHQCSELIQRFTDLGFFPYVIENQYSPDYLCSGHKKSRPKRLDGVFLDKQADLVFSRIDARQL